MIDAYAEYVALLEEECRSFSSFSFTHGLRSPEDKVRRGEELRDKIKELREKSGLSASERTAVFCRELEAFCLERGFEIAGTCEYEGIYGEITVKPVGTKTSWSNWEKHKFNFGK